MIAGHEAEEELDALKADVLAGSDEDATAVLDSTTNNKTNVSGTKPNGKED